MTRGIPIADVSEHVQKVKLLRVSEKHMTLIDAKMHTMINDIHWRAHDQYLTRRLLVYAVGYVNGVIGEYHVRATMGLHRFLLLLSNPGLLHPRHSKWVADHINGDGLDNRLSNLRVVSAADNARNRHKDSAPLALGFYPPLTPIIDQPPQQWARRGAPPRIYQLLNREVTPCP